MLDKHRSKAVPWLDDLAGRFEGWTPDGLSWTAFGLFVVGALLLALLPWLSPRSVWVPPILFFAVAVVVFLGGLFDALDGHVARRRGLASPAGDLLDHVLDRYADVVLLVGIALSGWAQPVLALLALSTLLLVSYMGTQAQASLGHRLYAGFLGRADRIVLVSGASMFMALFLAGDALTGTLLPAAWDLPLRWSLGGWSFTPIDGLLLVFVVGGQATAYWRARWTWRELKGRPPATTPPK